MSLADAVFKNLVEEQDLFFLLSHDSVLTLPRAQLNPLKTFTWSKQWGTGRKTLHSST